jgi:hypothetical protein
MRSFAVIPIKQSLDITGITRERGFEDVIFMLELKRIFETA